VKLLLAIRANCRNSQSTFFIRVSHKSNAIVAATDQRFLLALSPGESAHGFFDYPARSCAAQFSCGIIPSDPVQNSEAAVRSVNFQRGSRDSSNNRQYYLHP